MNFSKEFKEALSHLPAKEKDKLILRLLRKDLLLANRLLFELVNTDTVEEQRNKVEEGLLQKIKRSHEEFYNIAYLNWDVREFSGIINQHVSVTKDKFGEAYLNLIMINKVLDLNKDNILSAYPPRKVYKFCIAVIARAFKILLLIDKLDSDYFIELEEHIVRFGNLISDNDYLMDTAIKNGLDVNWLLCAEIPDDIASIYKQIRASGFLR